MKSISNISASSADSRLLVFFFENSGKEFYEREIKDATRLSLGATNMHLKALAKREYILHRKVGRMNFYRLNTDNIIVRQMKKAYTLSLPFVSKIKETGKELVVEVYLYGSAARGEDTEQSDIDLLVIGDTDTAQIEKHFSSVRKLCKKQIKISLFRRLEWVSMSKKDPAFFERVEKDKIRLV